MSRCPREVRIESKGYLGFSMFMVRDTGRDQSRQKKKTMKSVKASK